jgi:hypothetical protein
MAGPLNRYPSSFEWWWETNYKGVPSSKTKYDIISDREPVPWGKNCWKVILKAAGIF